MPALIEKALAASIPVLIGALAAILGIGGIADKVKKIFHALSKPVMKAVDYLTFDIGLSSVTGRTITRESGSETRSRHLLWPRAFSCCCGATPRLRTASSW